MKKIVFIYSISLFFIQFCFAQAKQTIKSQAVGKVIYKQTSLWDSEKTGTLLFNNNESIYFYGRTDVEQSNRLTQDQLNVQIDLGDKEGWTFYKNMRINKSLSRDNIWTKYFIVDESIPDFNWKISDVTRQIGKYTCQKASCSFRGRDYEAWFTTDLPISYGPWKLGGLPGLILEAYDTNKEFKFRVESIEIPTLTRVDIIPPKSGAVMTYTQFRAAYNKKMKALVNFYKMKADPKAEGTLTATVDDHSLEKL